MSASWMSYPRFRSTFFLSLIILAAAISAGASAEKRNITEKDLFGFVWIGDPQVSRDGSRVAFVRVTADEKKMTTTPPSGRFRPRKTSSRIN